MGSVYFYHLTRSPMRQALRQLLIKARGAGWRAHIRAPQDAILEQIDEWLWIEPEDSFVPHGLAGGPFDHAQPILLSSARGSANNAQCLFAIDQDPVLSHEAAGYERVCLLFEGGDGAALQHARGQWKQLSAEGVKAQYWSEETGNWQKKAQSG